MAKKNIFPNEKIRLNAEGQWYHGDTEVTHERTVELFFKNVRVDRDRFYLTGEKMPVPIEVEDTAFFVRKIQRKSPGVYEIFLSDGTVEILDPSTFDVGANNVLYCRIKNGTARARFERKAYYDITKDLEERDGFYGLVRQNIFYPIKRVVELAGVSETLAAKKENVAAMTVTTSAKVKSAQPKKKLAALAKKKAKTPQTKKSASSKIKSKAKSKVQAKGKKATKKTRVVKSSKKKAVKKGGGKKRGPSRVAYFKKDRNELKKLLIDTKKKKAAAVRAKTQAKSGKATASVKAKTKPGQSGLKSSVTTKLKKIFSKKR